MRVDAWRAAFYYCSDSHISTPNDLQQNSVSPFPTLRASVSRREKGLEFNVAESLAAHSLHAQSSCIMFVCKVPLCSQEVRALLIELKSVLLFLPQVEIL